MVVIPSQDCSINSVTIIWLICDVEVWSVSHCATKLKNVATRKKNAVTSHIHLSNLVTPNTEMTCYRHSKKMWILRHTKFCCRQLSQPIWCTVTDNNWLMVWECALRLMMHEGMHSSTLGDFCSFIRIGSYKQSVVVTIPFLQWEHTTNSKVYMTPILSPPPTLTMKPSYLNT